MHIDPLLARLHALNLHGIAAHLSEIQDKTFLSTYLDWEEKIRTERSLHRRLTAARLGRFKPLSEFDWAWPNHIDRDAIELGDQKIGGIEFGCTPISPRFFFAILLRHLSALIRSRQYKLMINHFYLNIHGFKVQYLSS